jgi:hypothetical protein
MIAMGGTALYGALSALCLGQAIPFLSDHPALVMTLLGPPAILVWGLGPWPFYLGFSAAFGACVLFAVRGQGLRRAVAIFGAVVIWTLGGFSSYAVSI